MVFGLIATTKRKDDIVDYDTLIFRVEAANVMDMDNTDDLWVFLKTLIKGGARKLVVDMNGLEFIDSSGIGILIDSAKLLRQNNGDIVLFNVPSRIQKIFQPVKLNRFINIFETEEEVKNFFRLV